MMMYFESTFQFGKHKGEMLEDVIEDDPSYIAWLCENEVTEFDIAVIRHLEAEKII